MNIIFNQSNNLLSQTLKLIKNKIFFSYITTKIKYYKKELKQLTMPKFGFDIANGKKNLVKTIWKNCIYAKKAENLTKFLLFNNI